MDYKEGIVWNTKTTQYDKNDNVTYSKGTFNSVKHIEQLKEGSSEKVKEESNVNYEIIEDWNKLKRRCLELEYKGLRKPFNKDDEGFYKTSLNKKSEKISLKQAIEARNRSYGHNKNKEKKWRIYLPCYKEMNDNSSLVYLLIIKPE